MEEILGAIRRRWILGALGLVVSIAAMVGAMSTVGPTYAYGGTILLLPPAISTHLPPGTVDYTRGNPLFYLGALSQSRDILISQLDSKQVQQEMGHRFPGVAYSASSDILNSGPVVVLTTSGSSSQLAKSAIDYLAQATPRTLATLQERLGINTDARIRSEALTTDDTPTVSHKAALRRAIFAGGAVAALCLLSIMLLDNLLLRRRSERKGRSRAHSHLIRAVEDATTAAEPGDVPDAPAARSATGR